MEKTMEREIRGIEVTDELIAINKQYQKLGEICDGYDALIETLEIKVVWSRDSDELQKSEDAFLADREKQIKQLEKMRKKIADQMDKIWQDVNNEIFLSRMLKGAMMMKAFKEVELEEKQTKLI